MDIVFSNTLRVCTNADLVHLSAQAVKEVLGEKHGKYKYACLSKLDSVALVAMQAQNRHGDEAKYLRLGKKKVRQFLKERPNFLELEQPLIQQKRYPARRGPRLDAD